MAASVGPLHFAYVLLLTLCGWPATGQDCCGQCQCRTAPVLRCMACVSLVLDGCSCCQDCTKQLGELCIDPCDSLAYLFYL